MHIRSNNHKRQLYENVKQLTRSTIDNHVLMRYWLHVVTLMPKSTKQESDQISTHELTLTK